MYAVLCAVLDLPTIKNVYITSEQNYRHELVPVTCVKWTVT